MQRHFWLHVLYDFSWTWSIMYSRAELDVSEGNYIKFERLIVDYPERTKIYQDINFCFFGNLITGKLFSSSGLQIKA